MNLAVGVDIGGTKTSVGLVDETGVVHSRLQSPTPATGAEAVLQATIELTRGLLRNAPHQVVGVGIGSAGVIDPASRSVLSATDTLPGWAGTQLGDEVEAAIGLPVTTFNDVHAHAIGEARFGAGRGRSTVLVIAAGTGVGGALVIDGQVQLGAGCVAGHFGHMPAVEAQGLECTCGRSGHLEMIAAGPAVHAAYHRNGGGAAAADARAVFALADQGDAVAAEAIEVAGEGLGRAIGGLLNALDPDVVVVAGGLAGSGERWWQALRRGVAREAIPLTADRPVVAAELGPDAAIAGAASTVFEHHRPHLEAAR